MTKKMTTSQKRAELKRVSKAAKDGVWQMLNLADEILSDHEYVDQFGSEAELIDQLEADEFSHFGGTPKLTAMLRAYRANPAKGTWAENGFNLWVMIDLAAPASDSPPKQYTNWKQRAKEAEAKVEELEAELSQLKETLADYKAMVAGMRKDAA